MKTLRDSQQITTQTISFISSSRLLTALIAVVVFAGPVYAQQTIVDFEDVTLANPGSNEATGSNPGSFFSQGAEFNRTWLDIYNCCPGGWAASNRTDLQTPGPTNAYSAYAGQTGGGAAGSTNFSVATNFSRGESFITFANPDIVNGMMITNTTYSFLAVRDGDDGGGNFVTAFEAGDWFKLEIFGVDQAGITTGSVDFYLADFRNGNQLIVDDWTYVDLTSLGNNVSTIEFEMSSTDNSQFGMNTPAYFAVDNIVVGVPEPTSAIALSGFISLIFRRRRRQIV